MWLGYTELLSTQWIVLISAEELQSIVKSCPLSSVCLVMFYFFFLILLNNFRKHNAFKMGKRHAVRYSIVPTQNLNALLEYYNINYQKVNISAV